MVISVSPLPAIIRIAAKHQLTITAAESCTGGLVSAALTETPNSSSVFERGYITYSNAAKIDLLGVSDVTLQKFGAVSEEVACQMAKGASRVAGADIAIAVTGIAGPGSSANKPEGRVCFALFAGTLITTETINFGALGRRHVREAATKHALNLIFLHLLTVH
ncbi:MAG: CinA family protein, partial [Planktomarina sp.]|nr:CinA family protein [Planktomarina sp.]